MGDIYKKYDKVRVRISGQKIVKDYETDWRGWVKPFSGADRCSMGWGLGIWVYFLIGGYSFGFMVRDLMINIY